MNHTRECLISHLGLWAIQPEALQTGLAILKSGRDPGFFCGHVIELDAEPKAAVVDKRTFDVMADGIAVIPIDGAMSKEGGKFGTSTVLTRHNLKMAARDEGVRGVILRIDSPGGHHAGTDELAQEIQAVDSSKPVFAHIDDLGASAAYWVASQARQVSINRAGETGSIGAFAMVEDSSQAAEMAGVTVHVVSTGGLKGGMVDGVPVTDDMIAHVQERVDAAGDIFFNAVKGGRDMPIAEVRKLADGRVFTSAQALANGLVDKVQPFETTVKQMRRVLNPPATRNQQTKIAVEIAKAT